MVDLEICKGVAVVVDDKVDDKGKAPDLIVKIVEKIKAKGIPICTYSSILSITQSLDNLSAINFLILDWDLQGKIDPELENQILKPAQSKQVVSFIKKFKGHCFCPIFIFSNASVDDIKATLVAEELYNEGKNNYIFIKSKKDLVRGENLFKIINSWVNSNPIIYALKTWEKSFIGAKNATYWKLFNTSSSWPKVLWETFEADSVDIESSFNDTIYRLIHHQASMKGLDKKKIVKRGKINIEEIKDVIRGTMFVDKAHVPIGEIRPGDIYKKGGKYYLNIRPECDTVQREGFDGKIYCLKGDKVSQKDFKTNYHPQYGIIRKHNYVLVFGVEGKDYVRFNFKELLMEDFEAIKANLICRLLPPHSSDIQQQYSSYIGRFGIPRVPLKVLNSIAYKKA